MAAYEAPCSSVTGWVLCRNVELLIDLADVALDLAKADLHPATSIFIPLPSSSLHYFVAKINPQGIAFELLKLARVQAESGIGTKLVVGDRTPMDLGKMRERRKERVTKRRRVEEERSDSAKREKSRDQAGQASQIQAVKGLESR